MGRYEKIIKKSCVVAFYKLLFSGSTCLYLCADFQVIIIQHFLSLQVIVVPNIHPLIEKQKKEIDKLLHLLPDFQVIERYC